MPFQEIERAPLSQRLAVTVGGSGLLWFTIVEVVLRISGR